MGKLVIICRWGILGLNSGFHAYERTGIQTHEISQLCFAPSVVGLYIRVRLSHLGVKDYNASIQELHILDECRPKLLLVTCL